MAEQGCAKGGVSRRSARVYTDELEYSMELSKMGQSQGQSACSSESRYGSGDEREVREKTLRKENRSSSGGSTGYDDGRLIHTVDMGRDLSGLFPATFEGMGKQVAKSLQEVKIKVENRPHSFGVVVPGAIYRSSFPMQEDYPFYATLGLKTVVTLVDKEYPPEFKPFLKANGIRHFVIDMKGTKKVAIPEETMHDILDITLDKSNHPILIHCNHGKHRTGCAAAVIRHIAGWKISDIVEEYTAYAEPKVRECDIKYIEAYEVASLEGLFLHPRRQIGEHLEGLDSRFIQYVSAALVLIFICVIVILSLHI